MKTIDQIYHCQMLGQVSGIWQLHCHLHVFQPHPTMQIVMITDMSFEMGWFIPHIVERLAEQVVSEFGLDPARLVWVESYSPNKQISDCEDFCQVTFDWHNGKVTNPQWRTIAPEIAQMLTGEALQTLAV